METVKVGVIGCGVISGQYFLHCRHFRDIIEIVACADLDMSRAKARAEEFGIPKACSVEELLADPEIELVINLTIPAAHAPVNKQALESGKHVYVEKPFAVTREEGREILQLAKAKGLLTGCAPDTVLGSGVQTARKLIDDGWIGEPLSAVAFMLCPGHEAWHPDPEFYYKRGGGPLFDMGPYYLSALMHLIGPIAEVSGTARTTFAERTITSEPKRGTRIKVETPTHISGSLTFENGAIATMIMSFDVFGGHHLPNIEIYGSKGSLRVPDPNLFGGPVLIKTENSNEWREAPVSHPYGNLGRGIGVADMAYAIRNKRPHRASGEMGYHVLDAMHAILESAETGQVKKLEGGVERPQAMPAIGLSE